MALALKPPVARNKIAKESKHYFEIEVALAAGAQAARKMQTNDEIKRTVDATLDDMRPFFNKVTADEKQLKSQQANDVKEFASFIEPAELILKQVSQQTQNNIKETDEIIEDAQLKAQLQVINLKTFRTGAVQEEIFEQQDEVFGDSDTTSFHKPK